MSKAARANLTLSGMVSNGRRERIKEKDRGMEISAEQETRPRPYLHLPLAPGRLPCTLGTGEEYQASGRGGKRNINTLEV